MMLSRTLRFYWLRKVSIGIGSVAAGAGLGRCLTYCSSERVDDGTRSRSARRRRWDGPDRDLAEMAHAFTIKEFREMR